MKRASALTLSFGILALIGCTPAGGHRYDYAKTTLTMQCSGSRTVAVAVLDARKYIINGRHTPNYVGQIRAKLGNPWPVYTTDDTPMANAVVHGLIAALRGAGYTAYASGTQPQNTRDDVIAMLKTHRAVRLILVTILEWYSDTDRHMSGNYLTYHLAIEIMDGSGTVLKKEQAFALEEKISGEGRPIEPHVLKGYQIRFDALLNHPDICNALR